MNNLLEPQDALKNILIYGPLGALVWEISKHVITYVYRVARDGRQRRFRIANLDQLERQQFLYQDITADVTVFDVSPQGYKKDDLVFRINQKERLAERFAGERQANLRGMEKSFEESKNRWEEALKAKQEGKTDLVVFDNEDLMGFDLVSLDRQGIQENPRLIISATTASYIDHRAITDVYHALSKSEKDEVLASSATGSRFFGRLSAVCGAVITHDGRIAFPRRSRKIASDAGLITCGINEAMRVSDRVAGSTMSIPQTAMQRGLREEYGFELDDESLVRMQVWSLVLNTRHYEWYFYGSVDLRGLGEKYSGYAIQENFRTGKATDKYEYEGVDLPRFSINEITAYVRKYRLEMTDYGVSVPIMAAFYHGA